MKIIERVCVDFNKGTVDFPFEFYAKDILRSSLFIQLINEKFSNNQLIFLVTIN